MANYAIISLGGKQYVVREGQKLLVERLDREEGKTFQPDVLFLGGEGGGELSPSTDVTLTVVGHERGPKVRIGKYKPKSGYKRHTGFRAALTRVEVTGIGASKASAKPKSEQKPKAEAHEPAEAAATPEALPEGYGDLTVAQISSEAKSWGRPQLEAALAYEQEHANRKGAVGALESALAAKEES